MGKKSSKLALLHLNIRARDKIIGSLLKVIADNNISLDSDLTKVIESLYYKQMKGHGKEEKGK